MEYKSLFGIKLGDGKKPLSSIESRKLQKSFVLPQDDDAIAVEAVGGFYGTYLDMDGTTRDDATMVYKYREMATHPETESAIDDIVGEAIVCEDSLQPVKLVTDRLPFKVAVKDKIEESFEEILRMLQFHTKGFDIFRRWYVDSKLVYHIIVDEANKEKGINELRWVDPVNIQKIKQYQKEMTKEGQTIITGMEEFYVYNKDGFKAGAQQGLRISPDAIAFVSSGLLDSRNKKTVGFLHKAIKPLNQVRMMEDAVVIYRMSRAPERRIFYIDVGSLPKTKAEQYVRDLMNRYKNKLQYDAVTGEVRDDKRHMSMMEDFWLPRREGGKGTEITTLQGAQNLSELEDVLYFQKKLYQSLNVPLSRLGAAENKSFSIGKSTEITRDEIKFAKFISRLRNKFSELFYILLKTQLILKNIITDEEWPDIQAALTFEYQKDSYFAELKENEVTRERFDVLAVVEPYIGRFLSEEHVMKNILGLKDGDIEKMKKQIEKEKKEKEEQAMEEAAKAQAQAEMNGGMNPMDPNNPDMGNQPPIDPNGGPPPNAGMPPAAEKPMPQEVSPTPTPKRKKPPVQGNL